MRLARAFISACACGGDQPDGVGSSAVLAVEENSIKMYDKVMTTALQFRITDAPLLAAENVVKKTRSNILVTQRV